MARAGGDSVSNETGLPMKWSEHANVVWKCPLPADGASTPAIWGDAVFLTAQKDDKLLLSSEDQQERPARSSGPGRSAPALRRGARSRARRARTAEQQKFHHLHNMASPSPVTDGERVIVHFGNGDLAAYDFAGQELWRHNLQKEHGTYTIWWGHANSPVLMQGPGHLRVHAGLAGRPAGQHGASYLVAHDKRTGRAKVEDAARDRGQGRGRRFVHHAPPAPDRATGSELIVMGGNQIDAYDPEPPAGSSGSCPAS